MTFYRWLEEDSTFALEVEFAESKWFKTAFNDTKAIKDQPYKERGSDKIALRFLEVAAPEFRAGPDTVVNIGHIGNNIVVTDEKIDGLRKLREAGTKRAKAKLIEPDATVGKDNPAVLSGDAQHSLGLALETIKDKAKS